MLIDELDEEQSVSTVWSYDPDGALHHRPTGIKVTTDRGVVLDGREYRLSPHEIELDRDDTLGTGAGGVVQAGVHKPSGMKVAVKSVKVDSKQKREQMLSEIQGLIQAAGCPNLVQWYAGFVGKGTGAVHIVLECMDLGSVADLRRRLGDETPAPPRHVSCIAAQLFRGLAHLQSRRILHRDVKPENILHNSSGQVKLTDFGISKDLNSTIGVAATFVGTATYMAPERALGKDYGFTSDVWSAGMVIYELATGKYPYNAKAFLDLYECLCQQPEPRLEDETAYPPDLREFVARCLTRDELRRPDAATLVSHNLVEQQGDGEVEELATWLLESAGLVGETAKVPVESAPAAKSLTHRSL